MGLILFYAQKRPPTRVLFPVLCPEGGLPRGDYTLFYTQEEGLPRGNYTLFIPRRRASHGGLSLVYTQEEGLPRGYPSWFIPRKKASHHPGYALPPPQGDTLTPYIRLPYTPGYTTRTNGSVLHVGVQRGVTVLGGGLYLRGSPGRNLPNSVFSSLLVKNVPPIGARTGVLTFLPVYDRLRPSRS